jgi:hypothetical protein
MCDWITSVLLEILNCCIPIFDIESFKLSDSKNIKGTSNYSSWKYFMELILTEWDVYSLTDGSKPKPKDPTKHCKWNKKDIKAHIIISVNMRSYLIVHARSHKTTKYLWDKLKSLYESSSMSRRTLLRNRFNACEMVEGESVSTHW